LEVTVTGGQTKHSGHFPSDLVRDANTTAALSCFAVAGARGKSEGRGNRVGQTPEGHYQRALCQRAGVAGVLGLSQNKEDN